MKKNINKYFMMVFGITVLFPLILVINEIITTGVQLSLLLVAKWFVFSALGLRLFAAGLIQLFRPSFTAQKIFMITDSKATELVQELGVHNVLMGIVGMLVIVFPQHTLAIAAFTGSYFGVAGILHATRKCRSTNQTIAMIFDLVIALVVVIFLLCGLT
jgi:hypothetical protein